MKMFGAAALFCLGAGLSRVLDFFLGAIGTNVDMFHLAAMDSWGWTVNRDLRLFAIGNICLAIPLAVGVAYVFERLLSSRSQKFAVIAGVLVGAWFWPLLP